jgi:hypothetical protein
VAGLLWSVQKLTDSVLHVGAFCKAMFDFGIGFMRSAAFFGKLSVLEKVLHLFCTRNLKVMFAL